MTRALVDTGALLGLANPRDQYHARAVATGHDLVRTGSRLVGTTLVLAEFHAHLLRLRGPVLARNLLRALLVDPLYEWREVAAELVDAATEGWLHRFGDQHFSLTDAVSFEVMRRERITSAFAFDEDFRTAGYQLL